MKTTIPFVIISLGLRKWMKDYEISINNSEALRVG